MKKFHTGELNGAWKRQSEMASSSSSTRTPIDAELKEAAGKIGQDNERSHGLR